MGSEANVSKWETARWDHGSMYLPWLWCDKVQVPVASNLQGKHPCQVTLQPLIYPTGTPLQLQLRLPNLYRVPRLVLPALTEQVCATHYQGSLSLTLDQLLLAPSGE